MDVTNAEPYLPVRRLDGWTFFETPTSTLLGQLSMGVSFSTSPACLFNFFHYIILLNNSSQLLPPRLLRVASVRRQKPTDTFQTFSNFISLSASLRSHSRSHWSLVKLVIPHHS